MKKAINTIVFAQAKDNKKVVVSDKYVAHALFVQNKPIWEALGATRDEGVKGLRLVFKSEKNAKEFIAKAITHIDADEYAKARKTAPKAKAEPKEKATAPAPAKGKKVDDLITVTLSDGTQLQVKASALGIKAEDKAPHKSKGAKPTPAPNAKAGKGVKAEPKAEKSAPRKAKGDGKVDFSALAGKGKAANKEAAALMRAAGLTDGKSDEYKAVWAEWCKVR